MIAQNIEKLSGLCGVSGSEDAVADTVKTMFEGYCDKVYKDSLGSVVGIKKGSDSTKRAMIEAHIDEIGLMVTKITDDGFLKFTNVGGVDVRILPGNEVTVHGKKELFGVCGAIAPHLLSKEELESVIPKEKLFIDIGFSKEEAQKYVSVGDCITFKSYPGYLGKKCYAAKSQDDRTSVCVLLDILKELENVTLPFDLYVVGAVQEEVGLRGSATVTYAIDPDFAIAIDVCHGDTPDASENTFPLSSGTVFEVGPNISKKLSENIIKAMDENNIKYSIEACGGNTGTDAWAMQICKNGVPTALFSLPLRYMHTPYETVCIDDVKETSNAVCAFLKSLKKAGDALC